MIRKFKIMLCIGLVLMSLADVTNAQDWPNFKRYRQANAELEAPAAGQHRVVFMGNSITDMWIDQDPDFFADHPYIDRGISGQTTPQMLVRFRADVIHLKPDVVVILAGTNDIAGNTGHATLGMIEDNLASMTELASAHHIEVVLCSVLPADRYPWNPEVHPAKKIAKLNAWIRKFAHKKGVIYANYYPALVNGQGGMKKEYSGDGVHPNTDGFAEMKPIIMKTIHKALEDHK